MLVSLPSLSNACKWCFASAVLFVAGDNTHQCESCCRIFITFDYRLFSLTGGRGKGVMLLSQEEMDSVGESEKTDSPGNPEEERILAAAASIKKQLALGRAGGCRDPERNTTHWDQLLGEMKWMSDDFSR